MPAGRGAQRHWFYLEDMITGENRDVVTDAGGTEQDARNLLGDIWTKPQPRDLSRPVSAGDRHELGDGAVHQMASLS